MIELRRELWAYLQKKPRHVPPADSPSRPGLARLWMAAHHATLKRPQAKSFGYCGLRFGIVFIGENLLCVVDLQRRTLLVRPPSSMVYLVDIVGGGREWQA
jgi:hypothetical protein